MRLRAGRVAFVRACAVLLASAATGCLVSFDGYELASEAGGAAGVSGASGAGGGAAGSAGKGGAGAGGAGTGGAAGVAGKGGASGGSGQGGGASGKGGASGGSGQGGGGSSGGSGQGGGGGSSGAAGSSGKGGAAGAAGTGGGGSSGSGGAGAGAGGAGAGGAGAGGAGAGGAGAGGAGAGGAGAGGDAGGAGAGGAGAGGAGAGGAGAGGAGAGGDAGTGGAGGDAGAGGAGAGGCPLGLPGPELLQVPTLGGGSYCIDRTEVTNAQYADFLASNPGGSGLSQCSFNTSFAPEINGTTCKSPLPYDPVGKPDHPVTCVDWCDAQAYCAWAGKRLCGQIGGGTNAPGAFADATQSQWYNACSKGGTQSYPYAGAYNGAKCNGVDYPSTGPVPVVQATLCVGGYAGLHDMSGNVWEWEDSCDAASGGNDGCASRGGDWLTSDGGTYTLQCNSTTPSGTPKAYLSARQTRSKSIGFRCCKD